MKPLHKEMMLAAFLGLVLPWVLVNTAISMETPESSHQETEPGLHRQETESAAAISIKMRQSDGTLQEMDMDTYLTGVLLAELPASFELEAKMAQAVAARTFALKAAVTGGKHGDGSVCGSYACCQAYIRPEEYLRSGGSNDAVSAAREAARMTSGQVLTYDGQLIEATYFSCSGGTTEDAVAVWGGEYPYLKSVDSPGEEGAKHYTDTVFLSKGELEAALGISLGNDPEDWFGFTTYTAGGGVNTVRIGGKDFPGTEVRMLLGLRSTAFTVRAEDGGVSITTRGFGHRVGMSQYGAEAMAVAGSGYEEILNHYYRGTELVIWKSDEN